MEIYRDELGRPIEYGHRWEGSPPEGAYSRVSNLERFAPLHAVADALIEWLGNTFDVITDQSPGVAADLLLMPDDVVRAVRVVPRDATAAPLTFVLTPFPGVFLHAGELHDYHFPACGCDACDDDVIKLAEELEWVVRTVVRGGYSERFAAGRNRRIESRLEERGIRMQSGQTRIEDLPLERVAIARTALPPTGQWSPWQELPHGITEKGN